MALLTSPITWIILAIVALIAIIVLLVTHTHDVAHAFDVMRHDVAAVVDDLVKWVESHWKLLAVILATVLLGPIGGLVAFIATHFGEVKKIIGDVISWVAAHWKEILAWLVDPVGMAVHEILTHTHQIATEFDSMRHDVAATVDGLGHDIETGFDDARHEAAAIIDGQVKDIETGFDDMRHDVAAFADWLPKEVEKGFDDARHDAAAAFDALVHDVESAFDTLRHDTAAGVDYVIHGWEVLPGEIVHEFDALPGQLETVGRDVVNGLIHGVEDAASALLGEVSNLAGDVEKAFTDPLAIFSPSRVMYGHGANYVQGIIDGVLSKKGALLAAVGTVAGGMAQGVPVASAVAPASGSASVHVSVPMTIQGSAGSGYEDPRFQQYMQAAVQDAVLKYDQLNATNGLTTAWGK